MRPRRPIALLVAAVLAACGAAPDPTATGAPPPPPSVEPSASPDPTRGPDSDLGLLLRTLEGTHPQPFHAMSREELVLALETYEASLPSLSPAEAAVELMRIWATLSRERDGHQFVLPAADHDLLLPIRVYEFEGDLWITDAQPTHEGLIGTRVTAVGGRPITEVLAAVDPLVPRDGPATVPAHRPVVFLRTVVLEGLGFVRAGAPELTVEDADGGDRTVTLTPITAAEHADWAGDFGTYQLPLDPDVPYLADADPFTVHDLGEGTLYLRYRFVTAPAVADAAERIGAGAVDRLILDLRQNPGGENTTYGSLLELVQAFAAGHPGATMVLVDRVTFSAAANLATEIERTTDATFVGEATAGAPNFWADVRWLDLRTLPMPMRVAISTRYHEYAEPDDPRLSLEPDVVVPVTAADYVAGRDPALDAALGR